jgi:arsenical pump membrane protein
MSAHRYHPSGVGTLRIIVLLAASASALSSIRRIPSWCITLAIAVAAVVVGIVPFSVARHALDDLAPALLFLALAVPVAVLLDQTGFFALLAAMFGGGRHLVVALWLLSAGTVIVFNLDAAVVLLTPLYVRIADRRGLDPVAVGVIPALTASLASSVLPVSNLTNLIAVERVDASVGDFFGHTLLPSVIAIVIGGVLHVRHVDASPRSASVPADDGATAAQRVAGDRSSLRVGVPIVLWLVIGFTVGDRLSVPAWVVAGGALLALMAVRRNVPWRTVPVAAIGIAVGLGVTAAGAARHLPVGDLLAIGGVPGELATFGVFAVGANAINNLPALLVGLPALDHHPDRLWAVLLGVNIGPTLWVTGALSTLLWQSTMARLGHRVSARTYARFGARVGIPVLIVVAACRALQV